MRCTLLATVLAVTAGLSCAHRARPAAARAGSVPQPVFERQIRNAVDAGDGDYRVRLLRERIAAHPEDLPARLELAAAYRGHGFPEIALEHYRLAAVHFPDSADVAVELAKSLRTMGQRLEAARSLDVFLASHAAVKSPELLSWLGILRDELGQWNEGEKAHRGALAAAPQAGYLHNNLGYNLLRQGRREEAAAEFRQALEIDPRSALARNNLALALAPKSEQALGEWKRLYDPATAHSNMAAALIEQGRYAEARRELDTALGYDRRHPAALKNLQVVSELDGRAAAIRPEASASRWKRWKSALRGLVTGPLAEGAKAPGEAYEAGSREVSR